MSASLRIWQSTLLLSLLPLTQGVTLQAAPASNLDLSSLGQIALAGDFDAISLYQYLEQSEGSSSNGSQSVVESLPEGIFADVASADAGISCMCDFVMQNGTSAGIIVGGNFTSLGGVDAQAVALMDPTTGKVTPLPGIEGQVTSLLCDQDTNAVYVGGSFKAADSTNAIAWVGTDGWTNLAFAGFNGQVNTITKAPSGHIVFGGSFSGLGNTSTPTVKNGQVINLSTANISAGSSTTTAGYSNPSNIVCSQNGTDGSSTTWLLADGEAGYWEANMSFGFEPTMLRLWNTNEEGRGTKTFRLTALPLDGIMNLTYTDPATGDDAYCTSTCPLEHNSTNPYQDFTFVNTVGMNAFRIDISDWYGSGGGLDGIELFEDDIYAYADNNFNEPSCAGEQFASTATTTGSWTVTPSGSSDSEYLTATVDSSNSSSLAVVFEPDIQQAGNYTVTFYTPGCEQTNSCSSRGIVNVTGVYESTGTNADQPQSTTLYQTNDYEKYDTIYMGYVDAASSSFRPSVTLTPAADSPDGMQVVASRVRFQLINSTDGLNGMFEYNPNEAVVDTDFSESAINRAGTDLKSGAVVNSLLTIGDTIYAAGDFSDDVFENIMAFSNNQTRSLPNSGLNAPVADMYSYDDVLYIGGNFTNTSTPNITGLNNVAAYSPSNNSWIALGQGLNGPVTYVVPVKINVTSGTPETTISFSGSFTQIAATGSDAAIDVDGFAIWVPSQRNWLQNVKGTHEAYSGQVTAYSNLPNSSSILLAGTLVSQGIAVSGAVSLSGSSSPSLEELPIEIESSQEQQSTLTKRSLSSAPSVSGAVTGLFHNSNGLNITVLAGHFSAVATNGSTINNILFLNGSNSEKVTGFATGADTNSTVYSLAVSDDTLFVGGTITGNVSGTSVNGLILYNLKTADYVATQPPALGSGEVIVNAITTQEGTSNVFMGGNFTSAGSLGCPSVCVFDTSTGEWARPGIGLSGTVTSLVWASKTSLIAAGNLSINGNETAVATYDTSKKVWSSSIGLSAVPGPVTAMTPATSDASKIWITGTATNGSVYLVNIDGSTIRSVGDVFGSATDIRGLQILSTSKSHSSTDFLDDNQVLLLTGLLELPTFGNASAALFNGTTMEPFVLSTLSSGEAGSLSQLISSNTNTLAGSSKFCSPLDFDHLLILSRKTSLRGNRHPCFFMCSPRLPFLDNTHWLHHRTCSTTKARLQCHPKHIHRQELKSWNSTT